MRNLILLCLTALTITSCSISKYAELGDGIFADIQTNKGDIVVKLHYRQTPVTVANFVSLAEGTNPFVKEEYKGKEYYDGVLFHRVINDFMIQGGDPTGTGKGGPGYRFKDELSDSLRHDKKGIVSMANAGFSTNGSQFFITHKATPRLDGYDQDGNPKPCEFRGVSCHTVFGEVVKGLDVIDSIAAVPTSQDPMTKDRPLDSVVMNHVEIIRNGRDAKSFDAVAVMTEYFREAEAKTKAIADHITSLSEQFKAQKPQAETTPSGLSYIVLEEGQGPKPKLGETVMVNYAGYFEDGNIFDTSWKDVAEKCGKLDKERLNRGLYSPVPMRIHPDARVIPGFKEGLNMMKVGDRYRLFIPAHLAYGEAGYGPIPPETDLIFDLEITEIQGE